MRRKPTTSGSGGYNNNQQRNNKPRYQQGGHSGSGGGEHRSHNNHNNGGRPRKNYAAAREKYLAQARDALAAGDRVLAENYFQHADHCYRMMVEEGYQVRNNAHTNQPSAEHNGDQQGNQMEQQQGEAGEQHDQQAQSHNDDSSDQENLPDTIHQLPAFLTANFEHAQGQPAAEPVAAQSWEE